MNCPYRTKWLIQLVDHLDGESCKETTEANMCCLWTFAEHEKAFEERLAEEARRLEWRLGNCHRVGL